MNDAPADREHGEQEGWYLDPYGVHDQRWISKGRPSDLVRDGVHESKEAPPDRPPSLPLVPAPVDASLGWRDTLRADDADRQPIPDPGSYGVAAMDANVVSDNSLVNGPGPSGDRTGMMFESPFQRKMRQQARRNGGPTGGIASSDRSPEPVLKTRPRLPAPPIQLTDCHRCDIRVSS